MVGHRRSFTARGGVSLLRDRPAIAVRQEQPVWQKSRRREAEWKASRDVIFYNRVHNEIAPAEVARLHPVADELGIHGQRREV